MLSNRTLLNCQRRNQMLSAIIKKTVRYWMEKNIISDADRNIYEYGLELILSSIINIFVIIITGIFTSRLFESIALLAIVIPLQSCGGGYHAKTHMRCFLIMYIGWWWVMWIIPYINLLATILIICLSLVTIFTFAPITNENVPMSNQQYYKMKILVRCLSCVASALGITTSWFWEGKNYIGKSLIMGIGVVALSVIAAKVRTIIICSYNRLVS